MTPEPALSSGIVRQLAVTLSLLAASLLIVLAVGAFVTLGPAVMFVGQGLAFASLAVGCHFDRKRALR